MTEFESTPPDETILVSDLSSAGEASELACESKYEGTMTSTVMYETVPVCDAVDCARPSDGGAAYE